MLFQKEKISLVFNSLLEKGKKFLRKLKKLAKKFSKKYPLFIQFIQLNLLYIYASITLMFLVQNSLGLFPEFLEHILPFAPKVLSFKIFRLLASPEKTLFLYLIISEIVFNTKSVSLLFQYNFLLIFILEMIQSVTIGLWDIFCRRDMMGKLPEELLIARQVEIQFFTSFFLIFFGLYIYCYINSIFFKFVSFPKPFEKITDSVGFWLRIDRKKRKNK